MYGSSKMIDLADTGVLIGMTLKHSSIVLGIMLGRLVVLLFGKRSLVGGLSSDNQHLLNLGSIKNVVYFVGQNLYCIEKMAYIGL
jgi:hypothetical protein